mgnify:CR=1 FL=1
MVINDHEILNGITNDWPYLLGCNEVILKDNDNITISGFASTLSELNGNYPIGVTTFSASGIGLMMLVAIYMHFSVGDELIKSMPASVMLLSCLIIAYSSKKPV